MRVITLLITGETVGYRDDDDDKQSFLSSYFPNWFGSATPKPRDTYKIYDLQAKDEESAISNIEFIINVFYQHAYLFKTNGIESLLDVIMDSKANIRVPVSKKRRRTRVEPSMKIVRFKNKITQNICSIGFPGDPIIPTIDSADLVMLLDKLPVMGVEKNSFCIMDLINLVQNRYPDCIVNIIDNTTLEQIHESKNAKDETGYAAESEMGKLFETADKIEWIANVFLESHGLLSNNCKQYTNYHNCRRVTLCDASGFAFAGEKLSLNASINILRPKDKMVTSSDTKSKIDLYIREISSFIKHFHQYNVEQHEQLGETYTCDERTGTCSGPIASTPLCNKTYFFNDKKINKKLMVLSVVAKLTFNKFDDNGDTIKSYRYCWFPINHGDLLDYVEDNISHVQGQHISTFYEEWINIYNTYMTLAKKYRTDKDSFMFWGATNFHGDGIGAWDTGKVTDMARMFCEATNFHGDGIGAWDTGKVTDMEGMFKGATNFRGKGIGGWVLSPELTSVKGMFAFTEQFNEPIRWTQGASPLSPPVTERNTRKRALNTKGMFYEATAFEFHETLPPRGAAQDDQALHRAVYTKPR